MFQSIRRASASGASAAIQSRSSARNCAISGPRSSSMGEPPQFCSVGLFGALGADGEVIERDVPVGPRLLVQAEQPLADDAALDLVGAACDRGARAAQRAVLYLAAAAGVRAGQQALGPEHRHPGVPAL